MAQVWYIGPLAKQVGEYGADVSTSSLDEESDADRTADGQLCWICLGSCGLPASEVARDEEVWSLKN